MRIGLLGGSFNPAHQGHLHIARYALRRLQLDQVWMIVSPGNVLKPVAGMAPFAARLASARKLADGRHVLATGIEAALGTRYSSDTVRALVRRFPRAAFVWIMGADILEQLPHWHRWREFVGSVPVVVLPRPRYVLRALSSKAAHALRATRRPQDAAATLVGADPPGWAFLPAPQHPASATAIRAARTGGLP